MKIQKKMGGGDGGMGGQGRCEQRSEAFVKFFLGGQVGGGGVRSGGGVRVDVSGEVKFL